MKKHFTWFEAFDVMRKYNELLGYTSKGNPRHLTAVAVITEDSFLKKYTEKQRSYRFNSDNKAFFPGQISTSIYSDCLDGTDNGVRLDWYIPTDWTVDYCYFEEDEEWQEVASKMFAD